MVQHSVAVVRRGFLWIDDGGIILVELPLFPSVPILQVLEEAPAVLWVYFVPFDLYNELRELQAHHSHGHFTDLYCQVRVVQVPALLQPPQVIPALAFLYGDLALVSAHSVKNPADFFVYVPRRVFMFAYNHSSPIAVFRPKVSSHLRYKKTRYLCHTNLGILSFGGFWVTLRRASH
jgi:hypothetical protein